MAVSWAIPRAVLLAVVRPRARRAGETSGLHPRVGVDRRPMDRLVEARPRAADPNRRRGRVVAARARPPRCGRTLRGADARAGAVVAGLPTATATLPGVAGPVAVLEVGGAVAGPARNVNERASLGTGLEGTRGGLPTPTMADQAVTTSVAVAACEAVLPGGGAKAVSQDCAVGVARVCAVVCAVSAPWPRWHVGRNAVFAH